MDDLIVRPAVPGDHDRWLPLWDGYNAFYGRSGDTALDLAITRLTWQRFFDPYEPLFALVAEHEGELLGLTHYMLHRSTISVQPSLYLQDLFTAPDARGKGVARALIEAVYRVADASALRRVYWLTHESNRTAMQLYDRVAENSGFLVYRRPSQ